MPSIRRPDPAPVPESTALSEALDLLEAKAPEAVGVSRRVREALDSAIKREREERKRARDGGLVRVTYELTPEDQREVARFVASLKRARRGR